MFAFRPRSLGRLAYGSVDFALHPISFRSPAVQSFAAPHGSGHAFAKRVEDITVALALLAVLAIPMLVFAAMIRMKSEGPALFRQKRIGLHGQRFVMLKFRTMYNAGESPTNWRQATRGDRRVTPFGAFLRRTSLDELPQLLNVLAGSMSMVGPRPHAPGSCAAGRLFENVARDYTARHCVKPGMTGLAQVRGWRGETDTEEKLLRRLDCDLEYIETRGIGTDVMILGRTIVAVVRMLNAY
jgi:lipopolysaccharide/colanic/teichoic acid biosynthesis glycosyltransferase